MSSGSASERMTVVALELAIPEKKIQERRGWEIIRKWQKRVRLFRQHEATPHLLHRYEWDIETSWLLHSLKFLSLEFYPQAIKTISSNKKKKKKVAQTWANKPASIGKGNHFYKWSHNRIQLLSHLEKYVINFVKCRSFQRIRIPALND